MKNISFSNVGNSMVLIFIQVTLIGQKQRLTANHFRQAFRPSRTAALNPASSIAASPF